jgi:hypothetical protein
VGAAANILILNGKAEPYSLIVRFLHDSLMTGVKGEGP